MLEPSAADNHVSRLFEVDQLQFFIGCIAVDAKVFNDGAKGSFLTRAGYKIA